VNEQLHLFEPPWETEQTLEFDVYSVVEQRVTVEIRRFGSERRIILTFSEPGFTDVDPPDTNEQFWDCDAQEWVTLGDLEDRIGDSGAAFSVACGRFTSVKGGGEETLSAS
jgi:hypothetical protein